VTDAPDPSQELSAGVRWARAGSVIAILLGLVAAPITCVALGAEHIASRGGIVKMNRSGDNDPTPYVDAIGAVGVALAVGGGSALVLLPKRRRKRPPH
jgi:hypothetical protein